MEAMKQIKECQKTDLYTKFAHDTASLSTTDELLAVIFFFECVHDEIPKIGSGK
jgi:hypothetical protein